MGKETVFYTDTIKEAGTFDARGEILGLSGLSTRLEFEINLFHVFRGLKAQPGWKTTGRIYSNS